MIHQLFSIFDNKTNAFAPPFIHTNEATAIRAIQGTIQERPQDMMSKNPQDFELYYMGTFDDNNGKYQVVNPKSVGNIKIMLAPKEDNS